MILAEPHAVELLRVDRGALTVGSRQLVANAGDGAFSPDGTLVAFVREGDLWVANSDGTGQRALARTPKVVESGPSWLPSGNAIVYSAKTADGSPQVRVFRLPTGPSQKLADGTAAAVSPQGRIAYVAGQRVVVGGRAWDTATAFSQVADLAWSPDGSTLAYSATDAATGVSSVVVDDGVSQRFGPAGTSPVWSPDGSRIAFRTVGGLRTMAPDGSDVQPLGTGTAVDWKSVPTGAVVWPNLVQRPPSGLVIERARNGHWLLGFTSMVDNRGPGTLWIKGRRQPGAGVMQVRQILYLRSGATRVDPASGELHYVVAPPHYHWHMLGFVHAELRNAGDFALRVRDHKSGFCIADHYGTAIGVPHGPPRFLGNCAQFDPRATYVEEGASVGYTDRYPAFFHGQQLDITGLKSGRYWLVHIANEDFHLRELRYDDNTASALIRLTWSGGTPHVTTLRTCTKARC
ncbi:MAG TPA: lysyl oxidase family protein [Gaiellaceae bacterium]|nr:lysyl oxidase family protein [Gaiellaceae bacterium]